MSKRAAPDSPVEEPRYKVPKNHKLDEDKVQIAALKFKTAWETAGRPKISWVGDLRPPVDAKPHFKARAECLFDAFQLAARINMCGYRFAVRVSGDHEEFMDMWFLDIAGDLLPDGGDGKHLVIVKAEAERGQNLHVIQQSIVRRGGFATFNGEREFFRISVLDAKAVNKARQELVDELREAEAAVRAFDAKYGID